MTLKEQVEHLKRRVEELESRPVVYPYTPPPYTPNPPGNMPQWVVLRPACQWCGAETPCGKTHAICINPNAFKG